MQPLALRYFVAELPDKTEHPFEFTFTIGNSRALKAEIRSQLERIVSLAGITTQRSSPQHITVRFCELTIKNGQLHRGGWTNIPIMPPLSRMTDEEFAAEQDKLLTNIPHEFHAHLTNAAYDRGHSAGMEEVISELQSLVVMLTNPIAAYRARITDEVLRSPVIPRNRNSG